MAEGKVILLVDDDLTLLEMYEDRLRAEGYEIVRATNGEEALAKTRQIRPALMILDIMMPKVNGFDVLKNLRADPAFQNTPVIVLTALIQDVDRAQGKKLGATDYIVKSETMPGEVIAKIKKALGES